MILVTGSAGKTGRAIIRALAQKQAKVRGLVRRSEQVEGATALGATEVVVGDIRSEEAVRDAMKGVQAVYHICPNMAPDEEVIGHRMFAAARDAGVRLFVYHSVLHPQVENMAHHWHKMRVEEAIFRSGLPFVVIQPATYMQNILGQWIRIVNDGVYAVPYAVESRLSMVDLEDIGQAAARVLTEPGHEGAIYELCGSPAHSQIEVADILTFVLGKPVKAQKTDLVTWEQGARRTGMGDYAVDTLKRMFEYYEQFGFQGNSHVLGWLLGRSPTAFPDFVRRTAAEREH